MALNRASENSVMVEPAGFKTPADGTGIIEHAHRSKMLMRVGVIQLDPWLSPFKEALRSRYSHAQRWIKTIDETEGGLGNFSKGNDKFGFNVQHNGDIVYREWAPNAMRAYLIGDFSIRYLCFLLRCSD